MEKTGGPAFPQYMQMVDEENRLITGMTLRDYLAVNASDEDVKEIMNHPDNYTVIDGRKRYRISRQDARYKFADAMLKAREK